MGQKRNKTQMWVIATLPSAKVKRNEKWKVKNMILGTSGHQRSMMMVPIDTQIVTSY